MGVHESAASLRPPRLRASHSEVSQLTERFAVVAVTSAARAYGATWHGREASQIKDARPGCRRRSTCRKPPPRHAALKTRDT